MLLLPLTGDWKSPNGAQDPSTQYGSAPSAVSNANWPHCVLQKTGLAGCAGNVGMVSHVTKYVWCTCTLAFVENRFYVISVIF